MRIYTPAGDLAVKTFTFPDGQPHVKLETHEIDFRSATIETAIRSSDELLQTVLVSEVLRRQGYSEINLDIRYLLGARMDRPIGQNEPFTLNCVARILNSCGFSKVRILDAHSEEATRLIRNSENVLPYMVAEQVFATLPDAWPVRPDKGAGNRVGKLTNVCRPANRAIIRCEKSRNSETGKLSGFSVNDPSWVSTCKEVVIIDDICDGGGTFVGLAKELRKAGAQKVYLYVTHGIFSKGLPLEGIDHIYTTDSYYSYVYGPEFASDKADKVVVIPVSMKEMK